MEIVTVSLAIALGLFMFAGALALIVDTVGEYLQEKKTNKK